MSSQKEVYIVLTSTGTYLSQIIKYYTNHDLCHVSISFDRQLHEVYSFGRKDQRNPFVGRFVKEDLTGPVFKHANCAIYKVATSNEAYRKMKQQINHFQCHSQYYRYNFLGMIAVMFNIEWNRKNHYFCSHFVNEILVSGDVHLFTKPAPLITPEDFIHANLPLLYQGKLQNYIRSSNRLYAREKEAYQKTYKLAQKL